MTDSTAKKPYCPFCGSDNVQRDAVAGWCDQFSEWTLVSTFDKGWCNDCERETDEFHWTNEKPYIQNN